MKLRGAWALALAALSAACSEAPVAPPAPALWQIVSSNGEVEGWLFGTIHALPGGTEWRTDTLNSAFAEADALAVEVAEFDDPSAFRQLAITSGLGPLSLRVSSERRSVLNQMMADGGFRHGQFANVEDWAVALTLAQVNRSADPANGVDRALIRGASDPFRKSGPMAVIELEGVYAQLSIFDGLSASDQRALLHSAIDDYASEENEAEILRRLWISGDEEGLEEAITESLDEAPGLRKALLIDRNRTMAARVVSLLADDAKPLVAVGAAHMVGEGSIPALIRAQGFTVSRIQ